MAVDLGAADRRQLGDLVPEDVAADGHHRRDAPHLEPHRAGAGSRLERAALVHHQRVVAREQRAVGAEDDPAVASPGRTRARHAEDHADARPASPRPASARRRRSSSSALARAARPVRASSGNTTRSAPRSFAAPTSSVIRARLASTLSRTSSWAAATVTATSAEGRLRTATGGDPLARAASARRSPRTPGRRGARAASAPPPAWPASGPGRTRGAGRPRAPRAATTLPSGAMTALWPWPGSSRLPAVLANRT